MDPYNFIRQSQQYFMNAFQTILILKLDLDYQMSFKNQRQ